MFRRHRLGIALLFLSAIGAANCLWSAYPRLSPAEHRLVGRWMLPQWDPGAGYGTTSGPITNPLLIREFRRDRIYRVWVISADRPSRRLLLIEGRWRVVDGTLRTEDFEDSAGLIRDIGDHARSWARMSIPQRITGQTDVGFDLPDSSTLIITNLWREKHSWKRVLE